MRNASMKVRKNILNRENHSHKKMSNWQFAIPDEFEFVFTEARLYQRGVWHLWGLNRRKFLQIYEHQSVQVEVNRKGYYFTDYLYIFITRCSSR